MPKYDKIPDNNFKLIRVFIVSFFVLLTVVLSIWIDGTSNVAQTEIKKEETRIESESEVRKDEIILEYLDSSETK